MQMNGRITADDPSPLVEACEEILAIGQDHPVHFVPAGDLAAADGPVTKKGLFGRKPKARPRRELLSGSWAPGLRGEQCGLSVITETLEPLGDRLAATGIRAPEGWSAMAPEPHVLSWTTGTSPPAEQIAFFFRCARAIAPDAATGDWQFAVDTGDGLLDIIFDTRG
jgi:hypothetical protein